jgi:hypothetical protein
MVTIIRDRVRAMVGQDSLEQVKAQADDGLRRVVRGPADDERHVHRRHLPRSPQVEAMILRSSRACVVAAMVIATTMSESAMGQGRGGGIGNAREGALIDLTGQWVSVITEDWRWRMVTPPKGDTASVPLNPAGRKVADAWDLNADRVGGQLCKAFGPPGLIRQPGRLRIRWENDSTLVMESDAGTQTRRFHSALRRGERGSGSRRIAISVAAPRRGGSLVVTTNLSAGYLRPNGVPYSERAVVKEFLDSFTLPRTDGHRDHGGSDPEYLDGSRDQPQFRHETSCRMELPL